MANNSPSKTLNNSRKLCFQSTSGIGISTVSSDNSTCMDSIRAAKSQPKIFSVIPFFKKIDRNRFHNIEISFHKSEGNWNKMKMRLLANSLTNKSQRRKLLFMISLLLRRNRSSFQVTHLSSSSLPFAFKRNTYHLLRVWFQEASSWISILKCVSGFVLTQ